MDKKDLPKIKKVRNEHIGKYPNPNCKCAHCIIALIDLK